MPRLALLAAPLALSALVAACSAPAAPTDDETVGSAEDALRTPELAYFFVDRTPDGFVARGVNETAAACGREKLARCVVDDVDLSALGVSRRDARSLLDAIDDRSAPNAIVFLGTVGAARHGHRTLRAVEAWRAPRAARWGGTVYQVTRDGLSCAGDDCRPARALRLNAWRRSTVPDVVLAGAPAMATCRFVPLRATGCTSAYEAAEAAEATPAGLLVAGHRDADGAILAEQYFLRVGVGSVCADGGWNYCAANQVCDAEAGVCTMECDGGCIHGRGRGVMPYERTVDIEAWVTQILLSAPVEIRILPH
jgi:hypothetical protein